MFKHNRECAIDIKIFCDWWFHACHNISLIKYLQKILTKVVLKISRSGIIESNYYLRCHVKVVSKMNKISNLVTFHVRFWMAVTMSSKIAALTQAQVIKEGLKDTEKCCIHIHFNFNKQLCSKICAQVIEPLLMMGYYYLPLLDEQKYLRYSILNPPYLDFPFKRAEIKISCLVNCWSCGVDLSFWPLRTLQPMLS